MVDTEQKKAVDKAFNTIVEVLNELKCTDLEIRFILGVGDSKEARFASMNHVQTEQFAVGSIEEIQRLQFEFAEHIGKAGIGDKKGAV
jgi:hypothetical protein